MKGPKYYRDQISNIGIEDMEIDVSSLEKAMETLHQLTDIERYLIKLRYNLRTNIRKIRMDYMHKMQDFDEESKKTGLFGRKTSPDKIISKKKALIKEKRIDIAAYELIEDMIDSYLREIEDSKVYIHDSIQKKIE